MDYLYDGSFYGFLSCVHRHYYAKSAEEKAEGIFPSGDYCGDLIRRPLDIETDAAKAEKVAAAIAAKISRFDLERIYHAFNTETQGIEMLLLDYIRLGFRIGGSISKLHGDPAVFAVQKAQQRLGNEVHRLCGLVRFSAMLPVDAQGAYSQACDANIRHNASLPEDSKGPEILYAQIEPDCNVLEFLAPHFTDRFRSDPFIIHDIKRGKALIANNREWYITDFSDANLLRNTQDEDSIRAMWRNYFDIMAIQERINPKCQRNMLPARYWKHLPEMKG